MPVAWAGPVMNAVSAKAVLSAADSAVRRSEITGSPSGEFGLTGLGGAWDPPAQGAATEGSCLTVRVWVVVDVWVCAAATGCWAGWVPRSEPAVTGGAAGGPQRAGLRAATEVSGSCG